MSERGEPREDRVMPPEHVHLYKAPGMDTVSFAELLQGFGIRRDLGEWMEGVTAQLASLTNQIVEQQAQIEEMRQSAAAADPVHEASRPRRK